MVEVGGDLLCTRGSQRNQEEHGANCRTKYGLHLSLLFTRQECTCTSKDPSLLDNFLGVLVERLATTPGRRSDRHAEPASVNLPSQCQHSDALLQWLQAISTTTAKWISVTGRSTTGNRSRSTSATATGRSARRFLSALLDHQFQRWRSRRI